MKINKENAGYLFIIAILLGFLGLSIYLGLSGWYYYNDQNYTTNLQLGKTIQTTLKKNEARALSMNVEGSYLPGEIIPQIITAKNSSDENLYLRAKIFLDNGYGMCIPVKLVSNDMWDYHEEDGYYYYNQFVTSQNKSTFCTQVIIPDNLILQTTKKYMITVVFESVDCNQNVLQLWGYNPVMENKT